MLNFPFVFSQLLRFLLFRSERSIYKSEPAEESDLHRPNATRPKRQPSLLRLGSCRTSTGGSVGSVGGAAGGRRGSRASLDGRAEDGAENEELMDVAVLLVRRYFKKVAEAHTLQPRLQDEKITSILQAARGGAGGNGVLDCG